MKRYLKFNSFRFSFLEMVTNDKQNTNTNNKKLKYDR